VRWSRLRWRLRGAWLWPTFAALTVADALMIHARPLQGLVTGYVPAFLLAGVLNVAVVALAAPLGGRLLRLRRPDLPRVVAADYAGVVAVVGMSVVLGVGGLVHHRAVVREQHAVARALAVLRDEVGSRGSPAVRRHLGAADTIRVEAGRLYRSCIPTGDRRGPFCVLVHLDTDPPRVVPDGRQPNAGWSGR
jgi:hypothetical protein